jgi:F0F1-type ATP synthase membrane subunit b/b'
MSDEQIPLSGEADYRFLSLVMSLATAAWSQLGKVPNPATQKIEKDVEQARISIEFLRMLQEKMEGNLSVKEQELLDNAVSDLELNFADEVRKAESASAGATADKGPDIIVPPGVSKGPEIIKP